uniref:EGF-like domain-containing protein n=1 Tax=Accipiter nisus TaxID=211598 RepID=A0A8B9N590_9AVES
MHPLLREPPHPSEHPSLHACTHLSYPPLRAPTPPCTHPPTHPVLSPDVDECRRSPRPCPNGRCENSVGSYRCLCSPGYRPSAAGTDCQDVDECAQSPPPCTHGRCENLPGGYRCTCPAGYRGTAPDEPCQGERGEGRGMSLCHDGGSPCHGVNVPWDCPTIGSWSPCLGGHHVIGSPSHGLPMPWSPYAMRSMCHGVTTPWAHRASTPTSPSHTDIDECENHLACPGQECINTPGSFQCQPCREGFQLHRGRCAGTLTPSPQQGAPQNPTGDPSITLLPPPDVDECGDFCFPHGECLNTEGSYTCLCAQGYTSTPQGTSPCPHTHPGPNTCPSPHLPMLIPVPVPTAVPLMAPITPFPPHPADVDECQRGGVCEGGRCANTDGSFECHCPAGFRAAAVPREGLASPPRGWHRGWLVPADVDECQEYGASLCGAQRCDNIPGSYRCVTDCQPGYRAGDGGDCVGECRRGTGMGMGSETGMGTRVGMGTGIGTGSGMDVETGVGMGTGMGTGTGTGTGIDTGTGMDLGTRVGMGLLLAWSRGIPGVPSLPCPPAGAGVSPLSPQTWMSARSTVPASAVPSAATTSPVPTAASPTASPATGLVMAGTASVSAGVGSAGGFRGPCRRGWGHRAMGLRVAEEPWGTARTMPWGRVQEGPCRGAHRAPCHGHWATEGQPRAAQRRRSPTPGWAQHHAMVVGSPTTDHPSKKYSHSLSQTWTNVPTGPCAEPTPPATTSPAPSSVPATRATKQPVMATTAWVRPGDLGQGGRHNARRWHLGTPSPAPI